MKITLLVAAIAFLATPSLAQDHSGHAMPAGQASSSTEAYTAANARMHEEMMLQFTGDADIDFVRGMIPHHRGAVEMAEIVLQHGTDPEVRALAEAIIAAQEAEIAWMEEWLASKGLKSS